MLAEEADKSGQLLLEVIVALGRAATERHQVGELGTQSQQMLSAI